MYIAFPITLIGTNYYIDKKVASLSHRVIR